MTRLERIEPTLPSTWYFDPGHYSRELEAIWYREWVCVGRREQIAQAGDFFVTRIGTQQIIVTCDAGGKIHAYHNTCRHRGSRLCVANEGRFRNGRIVCPYHAWTYTLDGSLVATPSRIDSAGFSKDDFSLYVVPVESWGGFLFVKVDPEADGPLEHFLGPEAQELSGWPLEEMVIAHEQRVLLECNWKVFWENYSECYHCPRVHPELCKVVPVYRHGVLGLSDLPDWRAAEGDDDGRPRVAEGLETWTLDGRSGLPAIPGPDENRRNQGMCFASFTASMFVIAHPDYVRSVRMLPQGPEAVELTVTWLLMPGVKEAFPQEMQRMLELGQIVVEQDGRVCALNQQGLRSRAHTQGVLVAQEWAVHEFHDWLRNRLEGT